MRTRTTTDGPSHEREETLDELLQVRVSKTMKKQVQEAADWLEITPADWVRDVIDYCLTLEK
jgi:hypothetical protein